jgi:hypothetical protein
VTTSKEVGGGPEGDFEELAGPQSDSELASLREELAGVSRVNRRSEWTSARERRLITATLARTTRLDPGWRGDLRLVFSFVRDSLVQSPQLRLAAALLFVNCFVVLPAVAWVLLRPEAPEQGFFTGFEPPEAIEEEDEPEEIVVELPEVLEEIKAAERRLDNQENVRRVARFKLMTQLGLPAVDPSVLDGELVEVPTPELLFSERLRLLTGGGQAISLARLDELCGSSDERSLLALLALDRGLVLGRPPELGGFLNELALAETAGTADVLALHVLGRARAQGDWPSEAPGGTGLSLPAQPLGAEEESALRELFGADLSSLRGW